MIPFQCFPISINLDNMSVYEGGYGQSLTNVDNERGVLDVEIS